jgi:hypothetical protein
LQIVERGAGMEPFMEPSGRKRPLRERDRRSFYQRSSALLSLRTST